MQKRKKISFKMLNLQFLFLRSDTYMYTPINVKFGMEEYTSGEPKYPYRLPVIGSVNNSE